MPKNKVQFQKGLSLTQFLQDYGSEAQCEQALFAARWPDGLNCPRCGGARFCRLSTRRATFQCNHCKRQLSLLAGTVFQTTKLPLSIWFLAIYFLSQTKSGISALELGRKLGVNDNTAWLLKHKLMQTMRERDQRYRLAGTVQLDDAYLGGEYPGGKRGRGSPNKTPLLAAVQVTAEGQPVVMKLSVVDGFRTAEVAQWAAQQVRPGTTVHTDGLACFKGLEAAGCEHKPHVTGGGKQGCETPGLVWANTILRNVKRSLDGTYHACAPHYAARYLAEFQYRFNRRYELAALPRRLLKAAATTLPLPRPILLLSTLTAAAAASPIHRAFDNPAARGTGRRHSPGTIRGLPGGPGCDRYHWLPVHLVPSASPPCLPASRQPPKIHKPTSSGALLGCG